MDALAYAPESRGLGPAPSWDDFSTPVTASASAAPAQVASSGGSDWDAFSTPVAQTASGEAPIALEPGEHVLTVGGRDPTRSASAQPGNGGSAPSAAESFGRGIGQGMTGNFGDEISGVQDASGLPSPPPWLGPVGTLYNATRTGAGAARLAAEYVAPDTFGQSATDQYSKTVEAERAANEAAQQANPGTYMLGDIAGSLPTMFVAPELAPLKALGVAKTAGPVVRTLVKGADLATSGGAYGALVGAGGGEGGPTDRIAPATRGAAAGAVLGPVVGGTAAALGQAGRFVGGHLAASRNPQRVADQVVARSLDNDAANVPQLADQMQAANLPGVPPGVSRAVLEALAQKFGTTVEDVTQRLAQRANTVPQALTLADTAGPNTQALAGTIARTPGPARAPARQFLEDRQLGSDPFSGSPGLAQSQGERISERLGQTLGGDGLSIQAADGIIAKRSAQAEPLYKAAYGRQVDYDSPAGRDLKALLERVPEDAKAKANAILKIEDKGGNQLIWSETPNANGTYPLKAVPNMRQWDYIKRGLDTSIESARDPITGRLSTYGIAVAGLKREMLSGLDAANPAYRNARQVFAGHSDMLDALTTGKEIWRPGMTPEAVAKEMKSLSPGEQEMYRLGAANALRDRLANAGDGANKVRTAMGTPAIRDKMRTIAPDAKSMEALTGFMKNEDAMFATRARSISGSPTAERLGDAEDIAQHIGEGLHMAAQLKAGHVVGFAKSVFAQLGKINPEKRAAVMEAARQVVLNPDPDAVRNFMQRVNAAGLTSKARRQFYGSLIGSLPRATVTNATGMPDRPRLPAPVLAPQ